MGFAPLVYARMVCTQPTFDQCKTWTMLCIHQESS